MVKKSPANAGDTSPINAGGGRETRGRECMCSIADSCHCAAETNTTLLSNHMQFKKGSSVSVDSRKYVFDDKFYVILNTYFGGYSNPWVMSP